MVLDGEPDAALAERLREPPGIAGETGAEQRRTERDPDLAGAARVRDVDPRRVRGDAHASPCERGACLVHVLRGRPGRTEMRAPDVDPVEAERLHVREQRVEPFGEAVDRSERFVRHAVAVSPAVHRITGLTRDEARRVHRDRVPHSASTCPWSRSDCWSSRTSTSCTATPRRAAWAAARPAAWPRSISVGSMRTDPNATCEADRQTGTSRFSESSRRGVSERYGIA